jgi:hypothetical protein
MAMFKLALRTRMAKRCQTVFQRVLVRKKSLNLRKANNMCATCGCMKKKGKATKKGLSPKQSKIAGAAKPTDKIDGKDFKALKKKKGK